MKVKQKLDRRWMCFELWGGNQRVDQPIELPGLAGWLYSRPFQPSSGGGDVHYLSVCNQGRVSRIAVADVAGHGESANAMAEKLRQAMQRHTDSWDQTTLMQELNEAFLQVTGGIRFATAAVLGYYFETGELLFTNAGHPPALWYHAGERAWDLLRPTTPHAKVVDGLPLGIIEGTDYMQTAVEIRPNDMLIVYTDGITEAVNEAGEMLGYARLLRLAEGLPVDSTAAACQALIAAVRRFRGNAPPSDDETLLVLQRSEDSA